LLHFGLMLHFVPKIVTFRVSSYNLRVQDIEKPSTVDSTKARKYKARHTREFCDRSYRTSQKNENFKISQSNTYSQLFNDKFLRHTKYFNLLHFEDNAVSKYPAEIHKSIDKDFWTRKLKVTYILIFKNIIISRTKINFKQQQTILPYYQRKR